MPDARGWTTKEERERDALVAEKIFGYEVGSIAGELHMNAEGNMTPVPHYTTDMNAAWQVLQHLATRYNPKSRYDYEPFNRLTDALLGDREEIYPSHDCMYEIAKWTPETLCLAALRAVGVTIEE